MDREGHTHLGVTLRGLASGADVREEDIGQDNPSVRFDAWVVPGDLCSTDGAGVRGMEVMVGSHVRLQIPR